MPTVILPAAADPEALRKRRTREAQQSVLSLLDDLRHVVGKIPGEEWPDTANAVLQHHEPAIDPALLPDDVARLQTAVRDSLIAMRFGDEAGIWAAFRRVRDLDPTIDQLETLRPE